MIVRISVLLLIFVFLHAPFLRASGTEWLRWEKAGDFLKGKGEGVAVTSSGTLRAVGSWEETAKFEEPVLAAVVEGRGSGIFVATGHPARIYRVRGGDVEKLADIPAEQATAMMVDSAGKLWITTMAPGLLLEFDRGELRERGRLGEGGFWDVVEFDGSIFAAAGPPAEIFRLGEQGLERWAQAPDSFVRCLAVDGEHLLAGTSGSGLILSFDTSGRAGITADSPFTEISDLLAVPDGDVWAVALVGEPASAEGKSSSRKGEQKKNGDTKASATAAGGLNLDLPKVGGKTAVSEVLRMTVDGALLEQHRFTTQVAGSLALDGDGVLVGTGYEGEIWRFTNEGGARIATLDAVQAVSMTGGGKYLISQGPASVFRRQSRGGRHRFRGEARSFERPSRFGAFRIRSRSGGVEIRFRQGAGSPEKPVWLDWGEWLKGPSGESGLPPGRLLQWEIRLPEGGEAERVELARRDINLPPVFKNITVEKPGLIYLSSPPMSGPVISEDHPTFNGIFTTLGTRPEKSPAAAQGKKYWQIGYRTLSWKVSDPNRDPLVFRVDLESADGFTLPVKEELKVTQLAVDMRAVPDGVYRFRVEASDREANPGAPQKAKALSRYFEVDNTSPEIRMERVGDELHIEVLDASPLLKVEISVDGGAWKVLEPSDHLLDSGHETFVYPLQDAGQLLLCRAFDTHHNRSAAALEE